MIKLQEFLRNKGSLDDLRNKNKFNLIVKEIDNLVIFNYKQIECKYDEISLESRGIILEKDSWDIIHWPFKRFFNDGEKDNLCGINTHFKNKSNLYIIEKMDGSLFGIFYYNNKWNITTRGTIHANCNIAFGNITNGLQFDKYFEKIIDKNTLFEKLDKNLDYTFEIVGPENIIITPYTKNDEGLYLICLRSKKDNFKELDYDTIVNEANRIGTKFPKRIHDSSILSNNILSMKNLDEGYVIVDYSKHYDGYNYPRIKKKNLEYLIESKEMINSTYEIFGLVLLNIHDKYSEKFKNNQYIKNLIKQYEKDISELYCKINTEFTSLKTLFPTKELFGKSNTKSRYSEFIYKLYDNIDINNYIKTLIDKYDIKYIAKKIMKLI